MNSSRSEQRATVGLRVLAATALALAGLYPGDNPDTFGHLAQGRQIAELGRVPGTDTWSLLHAGRPWLNYEWLSDLLYFGLHATFGYDGLIGLKCVLVASAGWLLVGLASRSGGLRAATLAALTLVAAIPAMRFRLSDRPHLIGMFLATVYMTVLAGLVAGPAGSKVRARAGRIGLLAVLHVLWVNLHGSHLLGALITAVFATFAPREARRGLLALLGLEAVASCISPWGPRILTDAIGHIVDPRYRTLVREWGPWDANAPVWLLVYPLGSGVLPALLGPRLVRQSPATRAALVLVLLLGVASLRSIRFVGEFLLLSTPWLAVGPAPHLEGLSPRRFSATVGGAACALTAFVPWQAARLPPNLDIGHGISDTELPRGPGFVLARTARPARVFADIQHSWSLMWFAPRARFFVDGRVPFYGPEHVATVGRALRDAGLFDAVLRRADIDAVILKLTLSSEQRLLGDLAARPDWSLVFVDDHYALYVRDDLAQTSGFPRISALVPSFDPALDPRCIGSASRDDRA